MIYITTTDWKKEFERQDERLSYLLNHYCNLSKTNYTMEVMTSEIDRCQEQLYYGVVKDDIGAIIKDTDLSPKDKLEEIQNYLDSLL